MQTRVITVGSVTYAIKLRRLLSANGIQSRQVKISVRDKGCVNGVEINEGDIYTAVMLLRENNIDYTVQNDIP